MAIRSILFDLDGTLRDSRSAILPSLRHAVAVHAGRDISDQDLIMHAHSVRSAHQVFAPDSTYEDFKATYYAKQAGLLATIAPYYGHLETLEMLRGQYRLGLVSSSQYARASVVEDGIAHVFTEIVDGVDTERHKPDPEPILLALERLGTVPWEAIMVGDLPADILAAKSAGLKAAIGVTHGFGSRAMLEEAGADYLVGSLPELINLIAIIDKS